MEILGQLNDTVIPYSPKEQKNMTDIVITSKQLNSQKAIYLIKPAMVINMVMCSGVSHVIPST